jgi:ureidoacrylate peracid hydrolase
MTGAPPPRPERCAVVVVDLQNDYCHDEGAFARLGYDVSRSQAVIPHVEVLNAAARRAGVPVIFLRTTHGEWTDTEAWHWRPRAGSTSPDGRIGVVEEGTWGAELYRLRPEPGDRVIVKHRYSGFAFTPLELALRAKRRDIVVLAGTTTNVCVEATAIDALALGFFTVLVRECSVAPSIAVQAAATEDFADHIGQVVSLADLLREWGVPARHEAEGARPASEPVT